MPFSRYISRQSSNTIYLVTGTTYLFDVDTPENGGLKSTTPSVKDLLSDLSRNSLIGSILTPGGLTKKDGTIVSGDQLLVHSKDGMVKNTLSICAGRRLKECCILNTSSEPLIPKKIWSLIIPQVKEVLIQQL
ncbi:hypothetical protein LWM68_27965 [Niabella sp. W65]|nr:hypothetical protein [Niabella sp. W65]MCH7366270.1 hypothetical protein [Niabella sp. W65]